MTTPRLAWGLLLTVLLSAPQALPQPSGQHPPAWTPVPSRYRGQIIRSRVRHFPQKLLALTFDDGPDPLVTPRVLDTLKRHQARATFFVLGRCAQAHPRLVKRAAAEGHALGSHGYSHPARASVAVAQSELKRTSDLVFQATGRRPLIFRPPYGITTGHLCREAQRQGLPAVLWTISSADSRPIAAATIARNVIHTPNPGDLVLMHDGAGHQATAAALKQILSELGAAGFKFVTVPELLAAWDRWLVQGRPGAPASKAKPPTRK